MTQQSARRITKRQLLGLGAAVLLAGCQGVDDEEQVLRVEDMPSLPPGDWVLYPPPPERSKWRFWQRAS